MFVFCTSCKKQDRTDQPKNNISQLADSIPTIEKVDTILAINAPNGITRTIIQDKNGNIWFATWQGIIQYNGNSFTNITSKVSSARFFSVLEDRKGNFWFSSVGSGVYYYDGKSFRNFTTKEGLANDRVIDIYEDKTGNIWFGTEGGASFYDGKSFRNFTTKEGLSDNDVNSIIEDKTGKFWFGTRGEACFYDGKTFTIFTHNGKPFKKVRSIIEDKKGNIWLGGNDGLWRYDGSTFINFTSNFVGYIYEDKKGNIWTSSETAQGWALSRYDGMSLSNSLFIKPTVTEIKLNEGMKEGVNAGMIFGILEAYDGSIWFGDLKGVNRYDGNTFSKFKDKAVQK